MRRIERRTRSARSGWPASGGRKAPPALLLGRPCAQQPVEQRPIGRRQAVPDFHGASTGWLPILATACLASRADTPTRNAPVSSLSRPSGRSNQPSAPSQRFRMPGVSLRLARCRVSTTSPSVGGGPASASVSQISATTSRRGRRHSRRRDGTAIDRSCPRRSRAAGQAWRS